jgi:immunoglobulin-binding protein 1
MGEENKLTINERYKNSIRQYKQLIEPVNSGGDRHDSIGFQKKITNLISEFTVLKKLVEDLKLFSDNEVIYEVNVNYLPFLNVNYYLGRLYSSSLVNQKLKAETPSIENKRDNLLVAKALYIQYLILLQNYRLLLESQSKLINSFKSSYDPTIEELVIGNSSDPVVRRQEKIDNFRLLKDLQAKLAILDQIDTNDDNKDQYSNMDEAIIKQVYLDQIKFFSLKTFELLQSLAIEIKLLSNMPQVSPQAQEIKDQMEDARTNTHTIEYGYTTKVEKNPLQMPKMSDLISKQGKILQPFTITSNRQQLKKNVFGTGQVLPSMSVEEYLDYELANGKMATPDNSRKKESDDEDYNSDDELEKRQWDDWKDANPKGSGNIRGNIG